MIYFGTDGIRGIVGKELTYEICYKCGNALTRTKDKPKILIGRDTRTHGSHIISAFASGATLGGGNVTDAGIIPTAGVSYLTKKLGFDYGVVISASHNPAEHNGIKIFDSNGQKINVLTEIEIERNFARTNLSEAKDIGVYEQKFGLVKEYKNFLLACANCSLKGLFVALDCANGASYSVAPWVFRKLGATVKCKNAFNKGEKINFNCGALYPENLAKFAQKDKFDVGFCYDGDSDRLMVVDEKGNILDGDRILTILALKYKEEGLLSQDKVVGTTITNKGIEDRLSKEGIELLRSDVGDKYVIEKMQEEGALLGGEQSGHLILGNYLATGDGVLASLILSRYLATGKISLSQLANIDLYPQVSKNIAVKDKLRILNSLKLTEEVDKFQAMLAPNGRVILRASGTEQKIRIMAEDRNRDKAEKVVANLSGLVEELDGN